MSEKSCQSCNFIATNKSQLYKHKLKHHPEAIMKKGAQVKNESTSVSSSVVHLKVVKKHCQL